MKAAAEPAALHINERILVPILLLKSFILQQEEEMNVIDITVVIYIIVEDIHRACVTY